MMVLYMAFSLLMRPSAVETHILSHDSFLALDQAALRRHAFWEKPDCAIFRWRNQIRPAKARFPWRDMFS
jgi:hypothetical protein